LPIVREPDLLPVCIGGDDMIHYISKRIVMKWVHTLVDYDNAIELSESVHKNVSINLSVLSRRLARTLGSRIPDSEELFVRLYGGWLTLDNQLSHRGVWLLSEISNFRRKIEALRLRFTVVREILARSDLTLRGTYRQGGQKMVDVMIAVDLLSLAPERDTSLVLVSDDDDLIPAVVAGAEHRNSRNPVHLLRRRKAAGSAQNDHVIQQCNVIIGDY
jgi:uncharacterized LabA/DUF88 family protein